MTRLRTLFVGDDWAEDHHDVQVQDEHGRATLLRQVAGRWRVGGVSELASEPWIVSELASEPWMQGDSGVPGPATEVARWWCLFDRLGRPVAEVGAGQP